MTCVRRHGSTILEGLLADNHALDIYCVKMAFLNVIVSINIVMKNFVFVILSLYCEKKNICIIKNYWSNIIFVSSHEFVHLYSYAEKQYNGNDIIIPITYLVRGRLQTL